MSLVYNKYDICRRLCSNATCVWCTPLQWHCLYSANVTYDSPRSTSCYWKGTLASSDYCCNSQREYETKETNSLYLTLSHGSSWSPPPVHHLSTSSPSPVSSTSSPLLMDSTWSPGGVDWRWTLDLAKFKESLGGVPV